MAYTSGIRRERSRQRRRFAWRAVVWLLVAAGFIALGYAAYQTGTLLAQAQVSELDRRVVDLTAQLDLSRGETGRLQAGLSDARQAMAALQGRYDRDVPVGELAELFAITRERLGQSVPAPRLAQVLREAGPTRPCDTRTTRKRFGIQLPGRPTEEAASLLDGLIQVSANLASAGADPAKAVVTTVARAWAAEPLKLTGVPARQDIVINNVVLRLTVEASDLSGYLSATLSVCGKG